MNDTMIGKYRSASELGKGWYLRRHDGAWAQIADVKPGNPNLNAIRVTLADGRQGVVLHNQPVMSRTPTEAKAADR